METESVARHESNEAKQKGNQIDAKQFFAAKMRCHFRHFKETMRRKGKKLIGILRGDKEEVLRSSQPKLANRVPLRREGEANGVE